MTDKASLWRNPSAVNWTFSRDYLGNDKPEFKNTFILRCESDDPASTLKYLCDGRMPIALDDQYDTNSSSYSDVNLQAGSDGNVKIENTCDCLITNDPFCSYSHKRTCTPENCPHHFWTKEDVGDSAYFTLEAYDVKLQQMHCF